MKMSLRSRVAFLPVLALAGCSTLETLPVVSELPKVPIPDVLKIETTLDAPRTPIERALSDCDKRTEDGETACVKSAIAQEKLTPVALAAMLPGCRVGQVCHTSYTTEDRVGFYSGTASRFVVHWRVDVDLRGPGTATGAIPVDVKQV